MRFTINYAVALAGLIVSALCVADSGQSPRTTQQQLIGAWRLVAIEVGGREVDPFYGKGSRGLLIYDASGWFSVQIEGSGRPAVKVPAARPLPHQSEAEARRNAAALHSYYAYYGTWVFDPVTSTVTHHAKGALYPSEDEAIYPQHVEVVGRRMTFTRMQGTTVQKKLWERVNSD